MAGDRVGGSRRLTWTDSRLIESESRDACCDLRNLLRGVELGVTVVWDQRPGIAPLPSLVGTQFAMQGLDLVPPATATDFCVIDAKHFFTTSDTLVFTVQ